MRAPDPAEKIGGFTVESLEQERKTKEVLRQFDTMGRLAYLEPRVAELERKVELLATPAPTPRGAYCSADEGDRDCRCDECQDRDLYVCEACGSRLITGAHPGDHGWEWGGDPDGDTYPFCFACVRSYEAEPEVGGA